MIRKVEKEEVDSNVYSHSTDLVGQHGLLDLEMGVMKVITNETAEKESNRTSLVKSSEGFLPFVGRLAPRHSEESWVIYGFESEDMRRSSIKKYLSIAHIFSQDSVSSSDMLAEESDGVIPDKLKNVARESINTFLNMLFALHQVHENGLIHGNIAVDRFISFPATQFVALWGFGTIGSAIGSSAPHPNDIQRDTTAIADIYFPLAYRASVMAHSPNADEEEDGNPFEKLAQLLQSAKEGEIKSVAQFMMRIYDLMRDYPALFRLQSSRGLNAEIKLIVQSQQLAVAGTAYPIREQEVFTPEAYGQVTDKDVQMVAKLELEKKKGTRPSTISGHRASEAAYSHLTPWIAGEEEINENDFLPTEIMHDLVTKSVQKALAISRDDLDEAKTHVSRMGSADAESFLPTAPLQINYRLLNASQTFWMRDIDGVVYKDNIPFDSKLLNTTTVHISSNDIANAAIHLNRPLLLPSLKYLQSRVKQFKILSQFNDDMVTSFLVGIKRNLQG